MNYLKGIPAIAALVFFLITCSNQSELPTSPPINGEGDISSSSSQGGEQEQISSSSIEQSVSSSSRETALSSSSSRSSSGTASSSSVLSSSARSSSSIAAVPPVNTAKDNFTETVGNVSFDMIYIPGGTFTIGCEKESGCPSDTKPVSGVTVSNYFIAKTEITTGLWKAVMGSEGVPTYSQNSSSFTNMTWYDAMEFTCKLSQMTGTKSHMPTEAECE